MLRWSARSSAWRVRRSPSASRPRRRVDPNACRRRPAHYCYGGSGSIRSTGEFPPRKDLKPTFFFDVINRTGFVEDQEGAELADREAARLQALDSIRSIVAEETRGGIVDLRGRIEVRGDAGLIFSVGFEEAVKVMTGAIPGTSGDAPEAG